LPPGLGVDDLLFLRNSLLERLQGLAQRIRATRNDILAFSSLVDWFEQAILDNDSLTDEQRQFFMQTINEQREGIATGRGALDEQQAACDEITQMVWAVDAPLAAGRVRN
jgi:predicted ATP-binding protein involved in virulence